MNGNGRKGFLYEPTIRLKASKAEDKEISFLEIHVGPSQTCIKLNCMYSNQLHRYVHSIE